MEVTGDLSGWQTVEITYFMSPTLDFSPPTVSQPPPHSCSHWISHFPWGFFPTCMPHYILKVNPINTEITLEDKLLRRAFFGLITTAWSPQLHFCIDNVYH